jgi:hypothetical protein
VISIARYQNLKAHGSLNETSTIVVAANSDFTEASGQKAGFRSDALLKSKLKL